MRTSFSLSGLTIIWLSLASNGFAQPSSAEELESKVRDAVVRAVVENPVLQGAWVKVETPQNPDDKLKLLAFFDKNPEIEVLQQRELDRIVKQIVKDAEIEVQETDKLPFRQFVDELQIEIELSSDLAGASLTSAYLSSDANPDNIDLFLVGSVVSEDQRSRMTDLANEKFAVLFAGTFLADSDVKTLHETEGYPEVANAKPAPLVSSYCYNLALHRFRSMNYDDAYRSFTQALLESPGRRDIQYWRVICLIGASREADAKKLLTGLAQESRRKGTVPAETEVLWALETVQGPLRLRLTKMENSLFCKSCGF